MKKDNCIWCDAVLTTNNTTRKTRPNGSDTNNICKDCESDSPHRQWLEKCLTTGDSAKLTKIERYIKNPKRQSKWRSTREAKRLQEVESAPISQEVYAVIVDQVVSQLMAILHPSTLAKPNSVTSDFTSTGTYFPPNNYSTASKQYR